MEMKSVLALQFENATNLGQSFISIISVQIQGNMVSTQAPNLGGESELDEFVLGALQSKILIALLISKTGTLSSGMITKKVWHKRFEAGQDQVEYDRSRLARMHPQTRYVGRPGHRLGRSQINETGDPCGSKSHLDRRVTRKGDPRS